MIAIYQLWKIFIVAQQTPVTPGSSKYRDAWLEGRVFDAWIGPYLDFLGPVFVVIVALAIAGVLFIYSEGSLALPLVTVILISGFIIPMLPPQSQLAAQIFIVAALAYLLYTSWTYGGSKRL